jgi:small subunit ribosomal protein S6
MRAYELMVIFKADTEESIVQTVINRLEGMANEAGGSLVKTDKWGVREFAYEINKAREGFYVVLEFLAPNALNEVDRVLRLADEVIRHKFIRLPLDEAQRRGLAGATA